ncbi:hypothetical protein D3C87_1892150 [compost metagenome]
MYTIRQPYSRKLHHVIFLFQLVQELWLFTHCVFRLDSAVLCIAVLAVIALREELLFSQFYRRVRQSSPFQTCRVTHEAAFFNLENSTGTHPVTLVVGVE